ncbi:MAG TPA: hypothetical protein VIR29_14700 [Anseongella sp.]
MMRPSIIQLTYMKRYLVLVTLLTMLLGVGACKKKKSENPLPVYPAPSWSSAGTEKYPFSMTAVVQLPNAMQAGYTKEDELGAFMNGECRGAGEVVMVGNNITFYVMIRGQAAEEEDIIFKYFSAGTGHIYLSKKPVEFTVDGNYGSADQPWVLELEPQQ